MFKQISQWLRQYDSCEAAIEPAFCVDPEQTRWDQTTDVLVVGFGGAGAATAIEANDQGNEVLVLERYNGGGATNISGGIYYSGGGTATQQQAGITDSVDNMYEYLRHEVQDAVSDDTLREFCNQSLDNYQWMVDQGVQFDASLCPYKTSYPSDSYYLYFSGNESFPPYTDTATPAPRGHRPFKPGISGQGIFQPLRRAVERRGIKVRQQALVNRLLNDKDGKVVGAEAIVLPSHTVAAKCHQFLSDLQTGVRYATMYTPMVQGTLRRLCNLLEKHCGKTLTIQARNGVVLSTGGFYFNHSMLRQYAPNYTDGMPLGTVGDDGSGIQLGETVQGATKLMQNVSAWRFTNPPETFIRGVLVGPSGQRICNEMLYGAQIGARMVKDNGGKGYLIIDQQLREKTWKVIGKERATWFQALFAGTYIFMERKKAKTLDELANKLNIPAQALRQTVAEYNANARSDEPDPMGKPKDYFQALEQGPFYALNCSYDAKLIPCPSITVGGLQVNEKTGQVLDADGQEIAGLYAAGRTAAGIPSHSYVSGLSIADCIFSGRRAGRHISNNENND